MSRIPVAAILGSVILVAPSAWAAAVASPGSPLPDDVAGKWANHATFPTFCQVPPRPRNMRTAGSFKEGVVALRLSGVRLVTETAPGTFSLEDTDGFASAARATAAPPPPLAAPSDQPADVFSKQARALAVPPGPR